jgi:glycosyltransferase involved in cell wall biosynthesis
LLSNFLYWFKNNCDIPFRILLKKGGELESEFKALAPVSLFHEKRPNWHGWYRRGALVPGLNALANQIHFNKLRRELFQDNIGLVYSNTITNGEVLEFLSSLKCPVITHVHELDYWIYRSGPYNLEQVKKYTHRYIAVSEAVKQNLIRNHGVPENEIDLVREFIPVSTITHRPEGKRDLRKAENIPKDAFIVGSSGHETWRKGKDLFIQLALTVVRKFRDRPVHFVWIGGHREGTAFYELEHDVRHAGISENIHFIDHVSDPLDYYREFDVFAMISREDPFPLVNLEAAALGKPIVCFDNAGGTPEFVEDDAGFTVPYLDISSMADKIITLVRDEGLRKKCGSKGLQKVMEQHDLSVGAGKILEIIERSLRYAQRKK